MSKKLLIIGAGGLIGSACVRYFHRQGEFDLLTPSRQELDILDLGQVRAYFKNNRPDVIILAAGLVGGIKYNTTYPADFITKNLTMQLNVFSAAQECEVERLFFFASSCMYPKTCPQPMAEEMLYTGHLEPTSLSYAVAKLAGVQMARAYNDQYQTERFVALIPNNVYGPQDNFDTETGHVMAALIRRFHQAKEERQPSVMLWGNGEPRREFVYVDEIPRAIAFLLLNQKIPVPLNLGTGRDISIKELSSIVADCVGYTGSIEWDTTKPNGTLRKLLDHSKLAKMGWSSSIELETGIEWTYQWFLSVQKRGKVTQ